MFVGTHTGPVVLPDGTELPPTGKRVEVQGMELVRVRDGKIVVDNLYYDNLAVAAQLGLLPQAVPSNGRERRWTMPTMKEAASEFLANKRIAVTGVSRKPKDHGANTVFKRLRDRGYEVFAVNPNADQVEGAHSYHDLKSIPGGVDAVVIATAPDKAEGTMRECDELGIKQVWMHRSPARAASATRPRPTGVSTASP